MAVSKPLAWNRNGRKRKRDATEKASVKMAVNSTTRRLVGRTNIE